MSNPATRWPCCSTLEWITGMEPICGHHPNCMATLEFRKELALWRSGMFEWKPGAGILLDGKPLLPTATSYDREIAIAIVHLLNQQQKFMAELVQVRASLVAQSP